MQLDPQQDYGFTVFGVNDVEQLPPWDRFRFEKIKHIFQGGRNIVDFGDSSRALSRLLLPQANPDILRISVDIEPKYRPGVVSDICNLPFASGTIDAIICSAILEHVHNPFRAVAEMRRVLVQGGRIFVYVPWLYRYHAVKGDYKDYWRFSVDGVQHLFSEFHGAEIAPVRGYLETVLNLLPYLGKRSRFNQVFGPLVRKFSRIDSSSASGFNIYAIK